MKLDVVTIEREVFKADDVDMVILPGTEGEMGVLPRHEPLMSGLKEGVLEIVRGNEREILAIGGGFVEVRNSHVIVMADVAEQSDEIDVERAEAARRKAIATIENAPENMEREEALASLRRAEVRLKAAKRRSGGGGSVRVSDH
jgi:F-type H+-transporting ATPase subunit epsilon